MDQNQSSYLVKVFGERNTGTRAMRRMLELTPTLTTAAPARQTTTELAEISAKIAAIRGAKWRRLYQDAIKDQLLADAPQVYAWKHAAPRFDASFAKNGARAIFVVRNPYAWALSLFETPYHFRGRRPADFDAFLTHPWATTARDQVASILPSPISLWNLKTAAYEKFQISATAAMVPTTVLKFEDFVFDPAGSLAHALHQVDAPSKGLRPLPFSTKNPQESLATIQERAKGETWTSRLTSENVALLNELIDWRLAAAHGYKKLDPIDFPETRINPYAANLSIAPITLKSWFHNRNWMSR